MWTAHRQAAAVPKPPPVLAKAVVRAAEALGLTQAELASILGTSAASVSRTFSGERPLAPESAEGRHALLLVRVFRSLDTLVGGDLPKARLWLDSPNAHLSGEKPRTLLSTTPSLVHVAEYLDAMRGAL